MRDRVIGPPPAVDTARTCAAFGCTLPPGCGKVCFIHDGLAPTAWQEATAAINRMDRVFRLCERMLNAAPAESVPDATHAAVRGLGLEGTDKLPRKSCRQYAYGLRALLTNACRPVVEVQTVAERMKREGFTPIADLITHHPEEVE